MADFTVLAEVTKVSGTSTIDWNMWMTILTALAAVFTAWNAWESRKSVRIAQETISIELVPYINFSEPPTIEFFESNPINAQIYFHIKNVGKVAVKYLTRKIAINGTQQDVSTYQTIILPPESSAKTRTNPFILSSGEDLSKYKVTARIEIEYWCKESQRYLIGRTYCMEPKWISYSDDTLVDA